MDDKHLCEIRIPVKKMSLFHAPNRRVEEAFSVFPQPASMMFKTAARSLFPRRPVRNRAGRRGLSSICRKFISLNQKTGTRSRECPFLLHE